MNSEKLSREQVPQKFAKWLLGMGCPPEKVPSVDQISEMCRGQYYMVWRSLMEHVEAKDVVRQKRLQVFGDDVQKWQKKSPFSERDTNVIMPEPLSQWQQHTELKDKVADMEARVTTGQEKLKQHTDKISMKLSQRNLCRDRIQELQRGAWLLHQVAADLKSKKQNLEETRSIADSLCCFDEEGDVQNKLEKCISIFVRHTSSAAASNSLLVANPVASSSVVSTNGDNDIEEHVSSLVKSRGDALWPQLCERRAGLVAELANTKRSTTNLNIGATPQSVLANTAALHCNLALEAMKNKVHIKQTQKRLAAAVGELSNYLSGEACELLVVRCERARAAARVNTLRALLDDISTTSGVFEVSGEAERPPGKSIARADKNIESKRDELKRLLMNLAATEKKILNIRECLLHIFNGFQRDSPVQENEKYRGHLEFPQESIATLRQFYEERRERMRNKVELSLDLDVSENYSFTDPMVNNTNPRFVDELRIYLKKFCLEKNRKLILESGEKIWIFESLRSSQSRLLQQWQVADLVPLVCPSVSLSSSIGSLIQLVSCKETMEAMVRELDNGRKIEFDIDISSKKAEEDQTTDKIKKRLNENLLSLQKTMKTLELGRENLKFWSDNQMKKYISTGRRYDGKTYKDYEVFYKETLSI